MRRIYDTRELEKACRENLGPLWLRARNDPDHNTLWRFWRDNRRALREVFRQVVGVARWNQLVGLVCHAVQGTNLRAACSRRTMQHAAELKEELAKVEASIAEMERAVEEADAPEEGEYRLPVALTEKQQLRATIRDSLANMQAAGRGHRHPQEPEAQLMKCEGRPEPAYNAHVGVDTQDQLVVAELEYFHLASRTLVASGRVRPARPSPCSGPAGAVFLARPFRQNPASHHPSEAVDLTDFAKVPTRVLCKNRGVLAIFREN